MLGSGYKKAVLLLLVLFVGLLLVTGCEPPELTTFTLIMQVSGQGIVTPAIGTHTYDEGTVVEITATPSSGWEFKEWIGEVANKASAKTTVVMNKDQTISVVFVETEDPIVQYTLTMQVNGQGLVNPSVGIHTYDDGTVVDITATPFSGWEFKEWEGGVGDPNASETTVTMDRDKTVKAMFEKEDDNGTTPGDPGDQTSHTVNGISFNMRLAPASTFPTGIGDSVSATVDEDFLVAETQVTYELWYEVRMWALDNGYTFTKAGREGSHGPADDQYAEGTKPSDRKNEPVTVVSWYDSIVWCNALSEMLGYDPVYTIDGDVIKSTTSIDHTDVVADDRDGFRLPTSMEWELAARYKGSDSSHGAIEYPAGSGNFWTPGNYASGATAGYRNATATQAAAWYRENSDVDGSGGKTQDVGQKPSEGNDLGLFDMSGNVWEWCFTQSVSGRVSRGGSWLNAAIDLRVGEINSGSPDYVHSSFGLRFVRTHF